MPPVSRVKELVSANMKLLRRSSGIYWLFLLVLCLTSILAAVRPAGIDPAGAVTIAAAVDIAISAFLFEGQFGSGEQERTLYYICSIDLGEIFFARNLATLFTVFPFYFINTLLVAVIAHAPAASVVDGLLYLSTGSFVLLHLGNLVSAHLQEGFLLRTPMLLALVNFLFIVAASAPYFVLVATMKEDFMCGLFLLLSVVSWYFVSIPSSSKTAMSKKSFLIGEK